MVCFQNPRPSLPKLNGITSKRQRHHFHGHFQNSTASPPKLNAITSQTQRHHFQSRCKIDQKHPVLMHNSLLANEVHFQGRLVFSTSNLVYRCTKIDQKTIPNQCNIDQKSSNWSSETSRNASRRGGAGGVPPFWEPSWIPKSINNSINFHMFF